MSETVEALVLAAEEALLHLSYMRAESDSRWDELETALEPFRPDCPRCGAKAQTPMHHHSIPYFCDVSWEHSAKNRENA